jgi:hypothetical protein
MHTFLLAAILLALCIALRALRRMLGVLPLLVLLLVLWATSHDDTKRSTPSVESTAPAPRGFSPLWVFRREFES